MVYFACHTAYLFDDVPNYVGFVTPCDTLLATVRCACDATTKLLLLRDPATLQLQLQDVSWNLCGCLKRYEDFCFTGVS